MSSNIYKDQNHCYKTYAGMINDSAFTSLLKTKARLLSVDAGYSLSITKLSTRLRRECKGKRKGYSACLFPARSLYSLNICHTKSKMTGAVANCFYLGHIGEDSSSF